MARSDEGPVMGEEGSPSECSCSKELVGGDGDMGGVCKPLSGAMAICDALKWEATRINQCRK